MEAGRYDEVHLRERRVNDRRDNAIARERDARAAGAGAAQVKVHNVAARLDEKELSAVCPDEGRENLTA